MLLAPAPTNRRPVNSPRIRTRRARPAYLQLLESRVLLAATLFVTPSTTAPDATHFHTLQEALAAAVEGDTVVLQSGFSLGSFNTTSLTAAAFAGTTTVRTADPLSIGQVVSIGSTSFADPIEQALITSVTQTADGDYLLTLATALKYNHTGSLVDATNATSIGKTIGIFKPITLTADAGVTLPFNLQIWKNTNGVTLSNLNLTTSPATSLYVDSDHNTLTNLTIANQLVLTNAHNNAITAVTVGNRLYIDAGSSSNTVLNSNLRRITLRPGTHHNTFAHSTIGELLATGDNSSSGYDNFFNNTFTGTVRITGNLAAPTNHRFIDNTFNVATGDALVLSRADGTLLRGNIFNVTKAFARAITVANSQNVVIDKNHATVNAGIAILAYADAPFTTSVDITDNTLASGEGIAISLGKWETDANLEARVQGNVLHNNAIGVMVYGDGQSAGNVDLGGGSTSFGASAGNNDFSSFLTADPYHFAIGLDDTSPDYTLSAKGNKFAVTDPATVIADATHNLPAAGTGIILATAVTPAPPPPEPEPPRQLALSTPAAAVTKGDTVSAPIATFTDTLAAATTSTYTVTITWSDGLTTPATLTQNPDGSFAIHTTRTFNSTGTFTATITISDNTLTTTATQDWSVTTKSGKVPPGKKK